MSFARCARSTAEAAVPTGGPATSVVREGGRAHAQGSPCYYMVERSAQAAMIIVFKGDKAEWLKHRVSKLLQGPEQFSHTVHGASLGLEGNFNKVALHEGLR